MMRALEIISHVSFLIGAAFFFAGTVALLRFPDIYTRLHALAKIDNLGLGFILFGLLLRSDNFHVALRLILIWILVLIASTTVSYLIARRAQAHNIPCWREREDQP